MYLFLGLLLLIIIILFLFLIFRWNRHRIIRKIKKMPEKEKLELLSSVTEPLGFSYLPNQDIFTSTLDAWQRDLGYCGLYDDAAPYGQMVFDCEPVYFNYHNQTWLIELWKGQYGITTGSEIGIYHTDVIIPPEEYHRTLFHAVSNEEMPQFGLGVSRNGADLFQLSRCHWWLTGFRMGVFSQPEELCLKASITFIDSDMEAAFLSALEKMGRCRCSLCVQGRTVTLRFQPAKTDQPCQLHPRRCTFAQRKNRRMTQKYLRITRPFENTIDRLLYLYYYLPGFFRKIFTMRNTKKAKKIHRSNFHAEKKRNWRLRS